MIDDAACPVCGVALPPPARPGGPLRRYCSVACRRVAAAARARQRQAQRRLYYLELMGAPRLAAMPADTPEATKARRLPKYEPLRRYLAAQPGDWVTLTFAEVEAILGAPLPAQAWLSGWWANVRGQQPPQLRAWWSAGWRVASVTLRPPEPSVTFARR